MLRKAQQQTTADHLPTWDIHEARQKARLVGWMVRADTAEDAIKKFGAEEPKPANRCAQNMKEAPMSQLMIITCGAVMALSITSANAAEVDINSANYMLPYCKLTDREASGNTGDAATFGRCHGIVQTIGAVYIALQDMQAEGVYPLAPPLCATVPKNGTPTQFINVILKYAEAYPEHTHIPFVAFAMIAIRDAWPCKN